MKIELLTIFPEIFDSFLNTSIIGRARANGLLDIHATDIRPFSQSKHKNTDDYPFGGGAGMLMMAQPIADAMKAVTQPPFHGKRIFLGPKGKKLDQKLAAQLSKEDELVILCGHYEGVDQRALDSYIDLEISIGDYILTGGETAAMVLIDCVSRLIPGVLGSEESAGDESFSGSGLLEYPQYTRPREFEGAEVPEVLVNGDHKKIHQWRREQALIETARHRADLLQTADITEKEKRWALEQVRMELQIESERLLICPFKLSMARAVFENSQDENNRRFVPDEVYESEEEARDTLKFLIGCYAETDGPFVYPILLKESGANIGYVQLCTIDDGWEIGYHIAEKYTGHGYASEAVQTFLPVIMGKLGISKVYGICLADNVASRHVLQHCGFQLIAEEEGIYQGSIRRICRFVFQEDR